MAARDNHQSTPASTRSPAEVLRTPIAATGAVADVLYLQRHAGNRAVAHSLTPRKLARFEVEGPFNKNDPVHEVLTMRAVVDAIDLIRRNKPGAKLGTLLKDVDIYKAPSLYSGASHNISPEYADKSYQQFIRGVVWADDPKGWLFDDDSGTGNYSSGLKWYEEFDVDEKDDAAALIARSHYGDLQFFHAMASNDAEPPAETKRKILEWARFLIDVATGRTGGATKLVDIPLTKRLFSAYPKYTVNDLFIYAKATGQQIQQRAAGTLLHLIQDSHAKGHVGRSGPGGDITEFHSYEHQDHSKHGHSDSWGSGAYLGERIKNTYGATTAIERCAKALMMIDQLEPTDDIVKWLDAEVFRLSSSATPAGPGADFKKK